jgi:hypothetical protein
MVVDDDQLPVRMGLGLQAFDTAAQVSRFVPRRNEDRDQRSRGIGPRDGDGIAEADAQLQPGDDENACQKECGGED